MSRSHSSISFKKRQEADEVYVYPLHENTATLHTTNSTVLVNHQDDGNVLVIAGKIPGMTGYYDNYDNVDEDEEKRREHEFSRDLLDNALDFLSEYDPETSSSKSNSGNRSMNDIYVRVDEDKRDEVVLKMWKLLNYMEDEYHSFLERHDPDEFVEHPSLVDEVVQITRKSELGEGN